jgi:hypothetical protein
MRQIPRRILNQSVDYYKRKSLDEYGNVTYETAQTINFVRLEPVKQSTLKALGEMKDDKLLMFYDYVNSSPNNIVFSELDKVVYSGRSFIIRTIADYIGHHAEVTLK